ncbi:MAG: zinc ribbon domain-containing protein, partial [Saccharolobus sp.]
IQKQIVEKALEYGVKVEFVDPKNTSKTCPRCGSSLNLMTGNARGEAGTLGLSSVWFFTR